MFSFMAITRALSDQNRVRTLMALRDLELCVCQIIELLELAPSTVSKGVRMAAGDTTGLPVTVHRMKFVKPLHGPLDHYPKRRKFDRT